MTVDRRFLTAANSRYTFPGAYEIYFVTDDSGVLCSPCVVAEWDDTISVSDPGDGWFIEGSDHDGNLDGSVTCDHCNRTIGQELDLSTLDGRAL